MAGKPLWSWFYGFCASNRYNAASGDSGTPELKDLAEVERRLQMVSEDLSRCFHRISEHQEMLNCILSEVEKKRDQLQEDKSICQMESCLDKMQVIYKQFKKARKCLRLPYNEEQIHKLDKLNLGHLAKKVLSVFQDDCVQKYQAALSAHGNQMRKVSEIRKHLKMLSSSIAACSVEMSGCQDCLSNALDRLPQKILEEKTVQASSVPAQVYTNQTHQDMIFGMQELREQMKRVSHDLQFNNSIIQRLSGVVSTPGL
uniref:TANK-binding kinase 1 coiled-coil domain-containing protein n=1 Tax=Sphenodon punctatus TaxID=8508 RepID=A0A8D0L6E9_SPHPU